MFAIEVIPTTASFRETARFVQPMPFSINLIARHVLDDADDVGLASAIGPRKYANQASGVCR